MRTLPKWVNKIHEADKVEFSSVYSICFSPDGTQLVMGAGERVMVYNPSDGALVQLLQAHKGAVHCVAYAADGRKFASGGADNNVVIWSHKMEGVLKYSHSDAIQCIAYNPITYQLASCAVSDFAFWSAEVKAVQKHKVTGKITCCVWSPNGLHLAIALAGGFVTIRDKQGEEMHRISREGVPIWAVCYSGATLVVCDWNDTISFHNLQADTPSIRERNIGISALSVSLLGKLIVVGGIGGWAVLTAEGVPIVTTSQEWVWSVAPSPCQNFLAVGCQDGTLWCYQIAMSTVHGLYRDRYAYRENMTDVIVQHLTSGGAVRIECHDKIHKIAIHKMKLAVQLPERVVVYEQGDTEGMLYRVKEKLPQKTECSLLVATSNSLLLCQDTKLMMIGQAVPRIWYVPSPIRYVKVAPIKYNEVLLLGLLNGQVWKVEPDNPEASLLLCTPAGVRCFDLSASRSKVAVVDENSVCRVYSLPTGEMLFHEENVSSVSWNSCCEDLLCMSGGGLLSIKAGNFPPATQPLHGSVVGFQGSRVFCLQSNFMTTINVPLSHAMHQYLQHKMFTEAYAVACLGVTPRDWERLGQCALEELSVDVAREAMRRTENVHRLALIDSVQRRLSSGEDRNLVLGQVLAHSGKLKEAARLFASAGRRDLALNLYTDLRMFNKAQEYVEEGEGGAALVRRRAEWARHVKEPRAAAEMFLAAGDVARATGIMAENGWVDMLMETARKLDKGSSENLLHVAAALVTAGRPLAAADVYQRLGDYRRVAQLAVLANDWSRAFDLAREHEECRREVYIPYANLMAKENKFVEAQKAFHMGGETETASRVLMTLVRNAVDEERFLDAAHLYHLLCVQCLESERDGRRSLPYEEYRLLARTYYAYDAVHRSVHDPFSLSPPETLFNTARYVLNCIDEGKQTPRGVLLSCVYLCLAKQAKILGAPSVARQVLDKMLSLYVSPKFQESVEVLTLKSRAEAANMGDGPEVEDELSVLCWRCRRHSPPLHVGACPHCSHRTQYSHVSFEVLPLVRLMPASEITIEEALELLQQTPLDDFSYPSDDTKGTTEGEAQVLTIDAGAHADPFLSRLDESEGESVVLSRWELLAVPPSSVVVTSDNLIFRNMSAGVRVSSCPHCGELFYAEDYEIQLITKGFCPFCHSSPSRDKTRDDDSILNELSQNGTSSLSPPSSPMPWN